VLPNSSGLVALQAEALGPFRRPCPAGFSAWPGRATVELGAVPAELSADSRLPLAAANGLATPFCSGSSAMPRPGGGA